MMPIMFISMLLQAGAPADDCRGVPSTTAARAAPNDNRAPAGSLREGVLTVRLAVRETAWHPDGPGGCGLRVHAFAEEGRAAQIPGPLIRVSVGTEVRVLLRNELGESVRIRGLRERLPDWAGTSPPGGIQPNIARAQLLMDSSAVEVASGEVREFRFRATLPGNFYYWGIRTAVDSAWLRNPGRLHTDASPTVDGQLVGALVIDPEGGSPPDRVFVMTHTRVPGSPSTEDPARAREVNAINGLSWPHTERLEAAVGDTLRWRVLNPAATAHTMHLHGFYYRILQRGAVSSYDSVIPPVRQDLVVSEFMAPNRTMTMEWVPAKPGNWLFHCHFLMHMSPAQRVARVFGSAPEPAHDTSDIHGEHDMAGPILGIAVRPLDGAAATAPPAPRRTLRLYANERHRVFGDLPGMGFVLQEGEEPPAVDSIRIPGTPLIMTRDEPTRITVFNRLRVGLGVHWHGIELDSYFDGVPGFSGGPGRISSAVQPGDSFDVHIAPPRAGTFIYHIHSEQFDELNSGLYGPLLVLEPGRAWERDRDHTFVLSNGGPGDSHHIIFINGSSAPPSIVMRQGVTQRLRFIAIPANGEYVVRLMRDNNAVSWTEIARDGADLPALRRRLTQAFARLDVGITRDFEFTPDQPGQLILDIDLRVPGHPTRLTIQVR